MEALAVIWAPVRTLSRVAEERRVLLAFGITALYAALNVILAAVSFFGGFAEPQFQSGDVQLPLEFESFFAFAAVFGLIWAAAGPFIFWLLVSGLMQLVTRFFNGTGPFSGVLSVVGVAQVPLVIAIFIQLPLIGLQIVLAPEGFATQEETPSEITALVLGLLRLLSGALSLASLAWFVVLVVIGAAFARRVGYGESAGSCGISCAGCVGLIILTFVVIVAVSVAFVEVLNSAGAT